MRVPMKAERFLRRAEMPRLDCCTERERERETKGEGASQKTLPSNSCMRLVSQIASPCWMDCVFTVVLSHLAHIMIQTKRLVAGRCQKHRFLLHTAGVPMRMNGCRPSPRTIVNHSLAEMVSISQVICKSRLRAHASVLRPK